jgi:hypothetical protein
MNRTVRWIVMAAIAGGGLWLLPPGYAQQRSRPKGEKSNQASVDRGALATLLGVLERHAQNDKNQSDLDRRVDSAMKGMADSRQIASRLVTQFKSLSPDVQKKLLGSSGVPQTEAITAEQFLDALKQLAGKQTAEGSYLKREPDEPPIDVKKLSNKGRTEEAESNQETQPRPGQRTPSRSRWSTGPHPLPVSLATYYLSAQLPVPTLEYSGIYCREESDVDQGTASDEIYIVTSVVRGNNVRSEKHPSSRNYYTSIDTGDKRNGPAATCWSGNSADLCLVTTVFEQDSSDNRSWRDNLNSQDLLVRLAVLGQTLGGAPACTTAPGFIEMVLDPIEDVPGIDDVISSVGVTISDSDLTDYADAAESESRGILYDFLTYHRGDGAKFRVYFRVVDN